MRKKEEEEEEEDGWWFSRRKAAESAAGRGCSDSNLFYAHANVVVLFTLIFNNVSKIANPLDLPLASSGYCR